MKQPGRGAFGRIGHPPTPPETGRRLTPKPTDKAPVRKVAPAPSELGEDSPSWLKQLMWMWANRWRHPGWVLVAIVVVLTAVALPLYPPAHAATCTWNASGQYKIEQTDNARSESYINLNLNQKGNNLIGVAESVAGTAGFDTGKVQGSVRGTDFHIEIKWSKGQGPPVGSYDGSFNPETGHLQGRSYDERTPGNTARWSAPSHSFACRWFANDLF